MALVKGVPFSKLPRAKQHAIFVAQLKKQTTPAENAFCSYLATLGLPYRFQQGFYTPYYRIADFYLPDLNLIIEIDGPSHTDPDHDRRLDEWFERVRGVKILRLTNNQVYAGDFGAVPDYVQGIRASG
jgi:very-short-patch-repair endonuclease